jgi:hypothetical protein
MFRSTTPRRLDEPIAVSLENLPESGPALDPGLRPG